MQSPQRIQRIIFKVHYTIVDHDLGNQTEVFRFKSYDDGDGQRPSWDTLSMDLEKLFHMPASDIALAYTSWDDEQCIISSQGELEEYYGLAFNNSPYTKSRLRKLDDGRYVHPLKVIDLGLLRKQASYIPRIL
jgi:hypothetical protein